MPKKLRPAGDLLAFKCRTLKVNIRVNMAPSRIKFLHVRFPIVTKINITFQVYTVVTVHDVVVWVVWYSGLV